MSVTDEVRKMVADAAGVDSSKVNERTELWRDLRIGGDDMLELFLELQNRFRVDLSGVDLRSYSPNEDDVVTGSESRSFGGAMAHTYVRNRIHISFSTKGRLKQIPPEVQPELWNFIGKVAAERGIEVLAVGGIADHVHVVIDLPPTMALSNAVRVMKAVSSKWMREYRRSFTWQDGYGAVSVGQPQLETVLNYVRHQPEHHRKHTFESEFLSLLAKHEISYNPQFVLG
jgi:putative transposase